MPVFDNYREISRAAANMIRENDTVYLTSGSFGHVMISFLPRDFHYTVIVNSVDMGKALREFDNIEVYVAGGKMRQSGSLVDSFAQRVCQPAAFRSFVLSPGAGLNRWLSGLSNHTDETAAFQRAVMPKQPPHMSSDAQLQDRRRFLYQGMRCRGL